MLHARVLFTAEPRVCRLPLLHCRRGAPGWGGGPRAIPVDLIEVPDKWVVQCHVVPSKPHSQCAVSHAEMGYSMTSSPFKAHLPSACGQPRAGVVPQSQALALAVLMCANALCRPVVLASYPV